MTAGSAALACPGCGQPLALRAGDLSGGALGCDRCDLVWCEPGALARLVGSPADLLDEPPVSPPSMDVALDAKPCPCCPNICLDRVAFARPRGPWIERCPYCFGTLSPTAALPLMRAAVARRAAPPAPPAEPVATLDPDVPGWRPLTVRQAAFAVPAAMLTALALRNFELPSLLFWGARVTLHELGHATVAWASSWKALPLPIGLTLIFPGRSWPVFGALLTAVAALVALGVRRRAAALVVGPALFAVALFVGTFAVDLPTQEMAVSFGGCAGELIYGAALVVLFHHRLPDRSRWDYFRWAALVMGAWVLVDASVFWRGCALDWSRIPWGGLFADDGDMTLLRDQHHWDELKITGRYVALSRGCLAVVGLWWAAHLAGALRRRALSGGRRDTPRGRPGGAR
jgi:hypothetical protein